ncbi:hypothetical protein EPUS_02155 [Endocarpon pusillum Z07020]|uniref:Uncharacterized protein n=1 Tax=Endocarpon pusillum (strain Z07020 / HMAS-L-300199) TaxID=1263415 RepID=U1GJE5_ENDPU|nr:uncharacterized protein EPUS_02155 [Endocarpon pusillum Z07020]ERF72268.1 hypothetical protein EPUS_02155 [Endocarpon pusillum Z07020]
MEKRSDALRFDGWHDWAAVPGNLGLVLTDRINSEHSLNVIFGRNNFVLFGRREGAHRLPRYTGFTALSSHFLTRIVAANVKRMRRLIIPGNPRLVAEHSPPHEMTLQQLILSHPHLRNLKLLVLEVCLLDYVMRTRAELNCLMLADYLDHLHHFGQHDRWHAAFDHGSRFVLREICALVNNSIWKTMVLRNAGILNNIGATLSTSTRHAKLRFDAFHGGLTKSSPLQVMIYHPFLHPEVSWSFN